MLLLCIDLSFIPSNRHMDRRVAATVAMYEATMVDMISRQFREYIQFREEELGAHCEDESRIAQLSTARIRVLAVTD